MTHRSAPPRDAELVLEHARPRQDVVERAVQILLRRRKSNPCLVGDPGVGKTAIAEGHAQRIADGDVPKKLLGKRVHTLEMAMLVAGTKYRGEFEERLQSVIAEATEEGDTIIDPCLGSGTTAVVAIKHNRRFIGIEKDEEYFKLACENIAKAEENSTKKVLDTSPRV